jgi:Uma2 family endonuclease
MITLEDATLMGINAPKEHQRIIRKLIAGLSNLYDSNRTTLEPFPETMMDEGQTSPVPDVMLYDNVSEQTPVIIEIAHTTGTKKDREKVRLLIESGFYGTTEGFVYDYKKKQWYKYKFGAGDITLNPSFCDTIGLDLALMI